MKAARLLCAVAGLALAGGNAPARSKTAPSPTSLPPRPLNVLFITADDFRPLIHAYGADIRTPNLDRLARESVMFTRAYAQWP